MSAVAPEIPGNVLEVLVKDNQAVKAGDASWCESDPATIRPEWISRAPPCCRLQSQLHTARDGSAPHK